MEVSSRRIARFAARLARDWTREIRFRSGLGGGEPSTLTAEHQAFIDANQRHWRKERARTGPRILVEGHLALSGPNYLFRTGLVAKAIEEATGAVPVVVLDEFSHRASAYRALYRSFGIEEFAYVHGTAEDALDHAFASAALLAVAAQLRTGDDLLALRSAGLRVGDLLYDDVIRTVRSSRHTVERVESEHLRAVYWANYYAKRYRRIMRASRATHAVSSHLAYVPYGLLARAAFEGGADVFATTDSHLMRFRRDRVGEIPVHHNGVHRCVRDELATLPDRPAALEEAAANLTARVAGENHDIDAQNAYGAKSTYGAAELRSALGVGDSRPLVFIMAHVFGDSPHLAERMLHRDYHHFLVETLKLAERMPDVQWIIKEHPSAALYGEGGEITALRARLAPVRHVSVCPADLSTRSVIECAHAVVTVNGTAGLEASCFGVPSIIAGQPFYAGFGFTHEPQSLDAYAGLLARSAGLPRLRASQIEDARLVWLAFQRAAAVKGPPVTMDDLRLVWGYGVQKNVPLAFSRVAERLRDGDPRKHPAYVRARAYALDSK